MLIDSTNKSLLLAYSASNYFSSSFDSSTKSFARTSFGNTYSDGREDFYIFKGSLLWPLLAGSFKRRLFLQLLLRCNLQKTIHWNTWFSPLFVRYKGDNIAWITIGLGLCFSFGIAVNRGFCTLEDKLSFEGGVMLRFCAGTCSATVYCYS